jgi:hypothetical protein
MNISAGPKGKELDVKIELPSKHRRIGVMVSGGADSAILLYLLALEKSLTGSSHDLIPITVPRTDGAWDYAGPIVSFINGLLGTSMPAPIMVGDPTLHHSQQTNSGEREARDKHGIEHIFYGSQKHPPVPMPGEYPGRPDRIHYTNNQGIVTTTCPFAMLDKRHTMALFDMFQVWPLAAITHSCTEQTKGRCGKCYNCVERKWALDELGFTDPGSM